MGRGARRAPTGLSGGLTNSSYSGIVLVYGKEKVAYG